MSLPTLPLREWCGFLRLLVNVSSDNQARIEQRELCGCLCHMALQKKAHHTRPQHPHVPMEKGIALQGLAGDLQQEEVRETWTLAF